MCQIKVYYMKRALQGVNVKGDYDTIFDIFYVFMNLNIGCGKEKERKRWGTWFDDGDSLTFQSPRREPRYNALFFSSFSARFANNSTPPLLLPLFFFYIPISSIYNNAHSYSITVKIGMFVFTFSFTSPV